MYFNWCYNGFNDRRYKVEIRIKKTAEATTNKIRIPNKVIEKFGREYYMEIYEDKIILVPMNK